MLAEVVDIATKSGVMKAADLDVLTRIPMHLNQVAITRAIEADGLFVIGVAHDVDEVSCSIFGIVNGSQPLLWAVEAHISGKLIRDLLIIFARRDQIGRASCRARGCQY